VLSFWFRWDCLQLMRALHLLDRTLGRHHSVPKYSRGLPHAETKMRPYNSHAVMAYVFFLHNLLRI